MIIQRLYFDDKETFEKSINHCLWFHRRIPIPKSFKLGFDHIHPIVLKYTTLDKTALKDHPDYESVICGSKELPKATRDYMTENPQFIRYCMRTFKNMTFETLADQCYKNYIRYGAIDATGFKKRYWGTSQSPSYIQWSHHWVQFETPDTPAIAMVQDLSVNQDLYLEYFDDNHPESYGGHVHFDHEDCLEDMEYPSQSFDLYAIHQRLKPDSNLGYTNGHFQYWWDSTEDEPFKQPYVPESPFI